MARAALRARNRRFQPRLVESDAEEPSATRYLSNRPKWGKRVYAICFDLDQEMLRTHYHVPSYENAYGDIKRILARHGFERQQGSVYFGDENATPVSCVLAVQDIARNCSWFSRAVSDIRMLRIEENNDLMPAIGDPQLDLLDGATSAMVAE